MKLDKKLLSVAISMALGIGTIGVASAAAIVSIKIEDVGSTTGCPTSVNIACTTPAYSSTLDGVSGLFRFNTINPGTATSSSYSRWTGDAGAGTIVFGGVDNPPGSFNTGFVFNAYTFVPFVAGGVWGGAVGDITGTTLTISRLYFGVKIGTDPNSVNVLNNPDANTLQVNWVVPTADPNKWKVNFQWSHNDTGDASPYAGFTSRWLIEGTATTAPVPLPPAAWLLGSGLASLARVARRRKARRV